MKPILMDGTSVRGILTGAKTQTRRIVKAPRSKVLVYDLTRAWRDNLGGDDYLHCPFWHVGDGPCPTDETSQRICAPISTGDVLWVRETWTIVPATAYRSTVPFRPSPDPEMVSVYRADWERCAPSVWRPSIHMPRWASRITLRVTSVRAQRLHSVSAADVIAEGCFSIERFRDRWESIHGAGSWDRNDWVWIYDLERTEQDV